MIPPRWLPFAIPFLLSSAPLASAEGTFTWSATSGPERASLIELYSSEGCSSCPPADRWLAGLRKDPGLWKRFVPLGFHVDYWNRLGWVDRFSNQAFTERQSRYASEWKSESVYTPEFVLNGSEWKSLLQRQADSAPRTQAGLLKARQVGPRRFTVSFAPSSSLAPELAKAGRTGGWTVHGAWLGNGLETEVKNGENTGRKLSHEFVVLALGSVALPASPMGSSTPVDLELPVPSPSVSSDSGSQPRSRSVAFWVTARGSSTPVQAVGGDLPGS